MRLSCHRHMKSSKNTRMLQMKKFSKCRKQDCKGKSKSRKKGDVKKENMKCLWYRWWAICLCKCLQTSINFNRVIQFSYKGYSLESVEVLQADFLYPKRDCSTWLCTCVGGMFSIAFDFLEMSSCCNSLTLYVMQILSYRTQTYRSSIP